MRPAVSADVQKFQKFIKSGMPGPHAYVVLLGLSRFDFPGVLEKIQKGLSYSALERLQKNIGLSNDQLLDLLQIPKRTLARRKAGGRLSPEESERLVRVARVFANALHLFNGDAAEAAVWLNSTRRVLGGQSPLELSRTEVGAQEVEKLVWQLRNGVFP